MPKICDLIAAILGPSCAWALYTGPRPLTDIEAAHVLRPEVYNSSLLESTFSRVDTKARVSHVINSWQAVVKVTSVAGDIVEAGVYRGGLSMAMAWAEMAAHPGFRRHPRRTLWLYDTFEGLPQPRAAVDGKKAMDKWASAGNTSRYGSNKHAFSHGSPHIDNNGTVRWNYGPLDEVRKNMASTGYPMSHVRLVKGKVEDTLTVEANLPERIAILRLDTDWFDSTRAELDLLFPRLSSGGMLLVDDYCSWAGARKAMDMWLRKNRALLREDSIVSHGDKCFQATKK